MKKIIIPFCFALVIFAACKQSGKTETTEQETVKSEIKAAEYQCPMDCEKGKTYTEVGKCPVCEMDLEVKS